MIDKLRLASLEEGERVETVAQDADSKDAGVVVAVHYGDNEVLVAWDSGVRTWIDAADIRIPA